MQKTVKAAVMEEPGKVSIQEFNLPNLDSKSALLKVEMVGVCGTDSSLYHGKLAGVPYPIIPGHEVVGFLQEAGDDFCQRHQVKNGDRVVIESICGCGECFYCQRGESRFCSQAIYFGIFKSCNEWPYLWGGYAEYMILPINSNVHKLPSNISPEVGVLICAVLGNTVRWLRTVGNVSIGETVVILGPGQQGLSAVVTAKECGANNIVVLGLGKDQKRLEVARKLGATLTVNIEKEDPVDIIASITKGRMADLVMDASGSPKGMYRASKLVKKLGRIVTPGLYGSTQEVSLILDDLIWKEVTIYGVVGQDYMSVEAAISIASRNRYPLEEIITHRFSLNETQQALKVAGREISNEDPIKVVIIP